MEKRGRRVNRQTERTRAVQLLVACEGKTGVSTGTRHSFRGIFGGKRIANSEVVICRKELMPCDVPFHFC
jgi:hypothetical protein